MVAAWELWQYVQPRVTARRLRWLRQRLAGGSGSLGDWTMLAQDIDFHEIFRISPTAMAVLTADLFFVDVNDQFLAESGRPLEELIGHNFFEIFPKMPADLGDTERMVLEEAFDTGRRAQVTLGRYDVEDPARTGTFHKHYWSSVVQPVRSADGRVEVYELSVRNLTPVIAQYKARWARRESPEADQALATSGSDAIDSGC